VPAAVVGVFLAGSHVALVVRLGVGVPGERVMCEVTAVGESEPDRVALVDLIFLPGVLTRERVVVESADGGLREPPVAG